MLKAEFAPDQPWFETLRVFLDLGYQGIQTDFVGERIEIPHKKPRKSQHNPNPQLTPEQKVANQAVSRQRIFVEHAIGGLKRFNILVHDFRNHREQMDDDVIALCAALWNFLLT